jgi:hypothetical protein
MGPAPQWNGGREFEKQLDACSMGRMAGQRNVWIKFGINFGPSASAAALLFETAVFAFSWVDLALFVF